MTPFTLTLNIKGGEFGRPWIQIVFEYDGNVVCFHGDEREFGSNKIIRRIIGGGKSIEDAELLNSYIQNVEVVDPVHEFTADKYDRMMDCEYSQLILTKKSITIEWSVSNTIENWPNVNSIANILRVWISENV